MSQCSHISIITTHTQIITRLITLPYPNNNKIDDITKA